MRHAYNDGSTDYEEVRRRYAKHILAYLGKRFTDEREKKYYVMPGLICVIYLPLPKDVKEMLKWSVKNGIIDVELNKIFSFLT